MSAPRYSPGTVADALRPFYEWADRNRSAVASEPMDELIRLARIACDQYTAAMALEDPLARLPMWQQIQFRLIMDKLKQWRESDHEDFIQICRSDIIAIIDAVKVLGGVAQASLKLGDTVRVNERSPFFSDWQNATLKVVSLRLDPQGKQWVSVIEGEPRHRANGVYDGETTDFDAEWLSPVTSTHRVGKYHADYSPLTPEEIAKDEPTLTELYARSVPVQRCEICDWPLAESPEKGCVPGDCSYRPEDPAEQRRIRERRALVSSKDRGGK